MDFSLLRKLTLVAFPGMAALLLAGCSSSEGFVDYADIPGPTTTETDTVESSPPEQAVDADSTADENDSPSDATSAPATSMTPVNAVSTVSKTIDDSSNSEPPADDAALPTQERAANPAVDRTTDEADPSTENGSTDEASVEGDEPGAPREIKLLIPEKRFRTEGDSKALRLSYDDIDLLKVLNMEPVPADAVDHFPKWLQDLDGKRVRLRGFMYPAFVATGITRFGLARDNGICCFVKEPKIYDMFEVSMADGESTDYIENKPFDVEGIFRIVPDVEDGELYELYRIEDAIVLK